MCVGDLLLNCCQLNSNFLHSIIKVKFNSMYTPIVYIKYMCCTLNKFIEYMHALCNDLVGERCVSSNQLSTIPPTSLIKIL